LLIAVIVLNLGSVWLSVRFNLWNRDFFDAIQSFNGDAFKHQFVIFGILATAAIVVAVYQTYLQQMLQIRWRRWLTKHYLTTWLNRHAYYRLQLTDSGTDNPDQRIADDLDMFTRQTLSLTVGSSGFLSAGVTLVSFLSILWTLSGALVLPLGSLGNVTIPGYMVWVALVYAAGGTWLAVKIGRPLVKLNFDQQRYEADFRFSMMRLRENAESVALYGGEDREQSAFLGHFGRVFGNFRNIMKYMKRLNWYTSGYNQLAVVFPYLVAAPRYFSKQISFGVLQQTADAFGQVQQSLSFIVNSYDLIADWQSVVQRLASFDARAGQIATETPEQIRIERAGEGIAVTDLDLDLPNGSPLLRGAGFEVPNGAWLLITGPAGVGKSTLLRAIAGIWPYGRGSIRLGQGRILFLSQRPYIPLGNLRTAILYPNDKDEIQDERLIDALDKTGLGAFASERDAPDNWAQRLSLGEQQRLAFARILLNEPAFIFMDEATSSLDEAGEAALYTLLRQAAWKPTVVSVGHRRTLERYHDRILPL
jgi:putative ATP-binding cassette transporter